MEHNEFIKNALKTESIVDELDIDKMLLIHTLQSFVCVSEILDAYKKKAFYKNDKKFKGDVKKQIHTLEGLVDSINFLYDSIVEENMEEATPDTNTRVAHGVIGIATEAGELVECWLDSLIEGDLDTVNLAEEMFDGDWYKAIISDELDIKWEHHWERIINKLKIRFGDKFSEERANNRDLEKERKALENDQ
jgi:hypothetical protein